MAIERMLIARAQAPLAQLRVESAVREEGLKGCLPDLAPVPVALEPAYSPIRPSGGALEGGAAWAPTDVPDRSALRRFQIWPSPKEKFDWKRNELFHKQVTGVHHRVAFEVVGNESTVRLALLSHQDDAPLVEAAFHGAFAQARLSPLDDDLLDAMPVEAWHAARFWDFHPEGYYCHRLTCPDEMGISHLESVLAALAYVPNEALGFYQVVFEPVRNNWHRNVEKLLDIEFVLRQMQGLPAQQRLPQQSPSGDLRHMAWTVEEKAHNDRPFFCMALRVGVVGGGDRAPEMLRQVAAFSGVFQHGGRPLARVSDEAYGAVLNAEEIRDMIVCGRTYRPGFLVNSWELTGPVHVPLARVAEQRQIPMPVLEVLPPRNTDLLTGTPIGVCNHAGRVQTICLPHRVRRSHCRIIGKPDKGKSSLMENMILHDILAGDGVTVLDPHGDLSLRLLHLIPEEHVHRAIYLNMGDRDFVPIWNPVAGAFGQEPGRAADDLVGGIKSLVTGWGDRLEHLLRHGLYAQLQIESGTLRGLAYLLRKGTPESERVRRQIIGTIREELSRDFWETDFLNYSKDDLGPPQHKLSKLLLSSRTVKLMLSQPDNLLNFRQIMDEGKILLVNLSTLGSEARNILGCFILVSHYLSALSRSELLPHRRKAFHIHCDEAHRFVTGPIDDIVAELRKFHVSLTVAHQYVNQFGHESSEALFNVGSSIIFNVSAADAKYLTRDLQELVAVKDIVSLRPYEAIAHIGTDVVRIRTIKPHDIPERNFAARIIAESRRRYYRPVDEAEKLVDGMAATMRGEAGPIVHPQTDEGAEFHYDEF